MAETVFIGDDFTGASDTLATLAERGVSARLFLSAPDSQIEEVAGLTAVGIATDLRARAPDEITQRIDSFAELLREARPRFVHYKICSTFDSAPHTGSIGAAVLALEQIIEPALTIVIGGQPSLGRYCLFGNLFARGPDGAVHRIDRHPVMSRHPVTPMGEADLRLHLAAQGLDGLNLLARGTAEEIAAALAQRLKSGERRVLADAIDQADIEALGVAVRRLDTGGKPILLVGASSVAEALYAKPQNASAAATSLPPPGPRLAIAGSRSSVTERQVAAATCYEKLPIAQTDFEDVGLSVFAGRAAAILNSGHNALAHLDPNADYGLSPDQLSEQLANLTANILQAAPVCAVAVAGGDTSSAVVRRLGFDSLSFERRVGPGVAICRGHRAAHAFDQMLLLLKGGQVGNDDLFDRFAD